ncbi:pyridoxamine 5'-phosphate oxidase family protein [Solirubrobacter ginsenosidimutans]|uniref:Pyridoxamine 5'-phosphate oxidase family protein n=1 Tax=Solirubrobacter ginsenosidimutans TaxID=490573 RepID=A0A9X3MR57_9ACTN|nr:pyridoxamine 5'-phosphate oxidase family protein [Solirubrobacter ginsenosidimutans]MDA0160297.1 pyridoxamine 5'-phosphate oxidase family protein [Solirubrobacter ginsenosidimutans]
MSNREPIETTNLDTIYGTETMPWSRPRELLGVGSLGPGAAFALGTVRPDGRPHAAGVGAAWFDGDLYFQCGPNTRKARNLAANPACTMFGSLPGQMDLVFEGEAERVTDAATLEALAAIYRDGGWPVQVEGDTFTAPFSAPSAGPPPWHLFRLTAHTVFGVASAEPGGATRWRF